MPAIRLIALDLDGTLLDSEKRLSKENFDALQRAHRAGAFIVPATGRFFAAMPAVVRALPFLRYAITINGARVSDASDSQVLYTAEIPGAQALEIMAWLDTLPVIYDCYKDNAGWMTEAMQRRADAFAPDRHYLEMLRTLRTPVPELKAFVAQTGGDVQKIQFFTRDLDLREEVLASCARRFPGMVASASCPNNVELNAAAATKGDGLNDISMLRAAGLGVAMGNAVPAAKAAADEVTADCDAHGVADVVARFFPETEAKQEESV